jgi:hypothetical protein
MTKERSYPQHDIPLGSVAPQIYLVSRKPLHDRWGSISSSHDDAKNLLVSDSNQTFQSRRQHLDQKPDLPAKRARRWCPRSLWTFELLSTLLSFLAFLALVIVLQHYSGRSQTAWPYQRLTLNGLVALLSTVTRVALLVPVAQSLGQGKWNWYSSTKQGKADRKPLGDLEIFDDASRGA